MALSLPSRAALVQQYVGRSLKEVPLPAAVLNLAAVKWYCAQITNAAQKLGWTLRVGVAGHKTSEITKLQIGEDPEDVRISVSSLSDAENLLPLLLEYQQKGLQVNVLYTIPVPHSQVNRLANISRVLGRRGGTIRLIVDHESQIPLLLRIFELSGYPPHVYIAVDCGDDYCGVKPGTPQFRNIFSQIEQIIMKAGPIQVAFVGFYCADKAQERRKSAESLACLCDQLQKLEAYSPVDELRLSIPETLLLTSLPKLMSEGVKTKDRVAPPLVENFRLLTNLLVRRKFRVEILTSVDPPLDVRSCIENVQFSRVTRSISLLTEIASMHLSQGKNGQKLFLAAGASSFGLESDPTVGRGLVYSMNGVHRSELIGYVTRAQRDSSVVENVAEPRASVLQCGQRVRIIPCDVLQVNNQLGWYFVVDSTRIDGGDEIIDVFVRWRD